jgi:hypothetical protein
MQRRALLIVAGLMVLAGLSLPAMRWAMTPVPGVTRSNFDRLHEGMRLEEIETVMGRPADFRNYVTGNMPYVWKCDEGSVHISDWVTGTRGKFVKGGSVNMRWIDGETVAELAPAPEGFLPMLRRWLHL